MELADFNKEFEKIAMIGEGSYGKVYLCKKLSLDKQNQTPTIQNINQPLSMKSTQQPTPYYALKKLKQLGYQQQSEVGQSRQVLNLRHFNHRNLMNMKGIVQKNKQHKVNHYLVMDYGFEVLEFMNHKELNLSNALLGQIIKQLVEAVRYIHHQNYIHRDIKPSNIFVMRDGTLKLGDFSITRPIDSEGQMTGNITTRHYRPPEIIFGSKKYGKEIDIWSLGCTLAQLFLHEPLFPGKTDINQLQCIFQIVGYPQTTWKTAENLPYYFQFPEDKVTGLQNILPNVNESLLDLIKKMLALDPQQRPTIDEVCEHQYIQRVEEERNELQKISEYIYLKRIKQQSGMQQE